MFANRHILATLLSTRIFLKIIWETVLVAALRTVNGKNQILKMIIERPLVSKLQVI